MKMQSPHKSRNLQRTPKTSFDLKRPQMTSKDAIENDKPVFKKVNANTTLRGGDPSNVNPSNGRDFTE